MRNEGIELLLANQILKEEEEDKPLLVRDSRECIIRVLAFEVGDQLRELMVSTIPLDRVNQSLPADDSREMTVSLSMNSGHDTTLKVSRPTLIKPEVLPRSSRDKVTAPAVRQLVSNDIDILTVLGDQSRSSEGVHGILHASVWEARWENENIVLAPDIREDDLVDGLNELVSSLLKLPLTVLELVGGGSDLADGTNRCLNNITGKVSVMLMNVRISVKGYKLKNWQGLTYPLAKAKRYEGMGTFCSNL